MDCEQRHFEKQCPLKGVEFETGERQLDLSQRLEQPAQQSHTRHKRRHKKVLLQGMCAVDTETVKRRHLIGRKVAIAGPARAAIGKFQADSLP